MPNRNTEAAALAAAAQSETSFSIRRDGSGIKTSWKTFGMIIAAAFVVGGIYWQLTDHGKRLDALTSLVAVDHDILIELRSYAKATEHARNEDSKR